MFGNVPQLVQDPGEKTEGVCRFLEICSGETDHKETSVFARNDRSEHKFDVLSFPTEGRNEKKKERRKNKQQIVIRCKETKMNTHNTLVQRVCRISQDVSFRLKYGQNETS